MSQSTHSRPLTSFRSGLMEVSVWRNEIDGEEGKPGFKLSVKVQKEYKDANGEFKGTSYFFRDELPRLKLLIEQAYEFIVLKGFEKENAPA